MVTQRFLNASQCRTEPFGESGRRRRRRHAEVAEKCKCRFHRNGRKGRKEILNTYSLEIKERANEEHLEHLGWFIETHKFERPESATGNREPVTKTTQRFLNASQGRTEAFGESGRRRRRKHAEVAEKCKCRFHRNGRKGRKEILNTYSREIKERANEEHPGWFIETHKFERPEPATGNRQPVTKTTQRFLNVSQ